MYGKHTNKQKKIQKIMNQSWDHEKNNHKPLIVVDAEHFVKIYDIETTMFRIKNDTNIVDNNHEDLLDLQLKMLRNI